MVEGSRMFSSETRVASDQQQTTGVFNHELGGFPKSCSATTHAHRQALPERPPEKVTCVCESEHTNR